MLVTHVQGLDIVTLCAAWCLMVSMSTFAQTSALDIWDNDQHLHLNAMTGALSKTKLEETVLHVVFSVFFGISQSQTTRGVIKATQKFTYFKIAVLLYTIPQLTTHYSLQDGLKGPPQSIVKQTQPVNQHSRAKAGLQDVDCW